MKHGSYMQSICLPVRKKWRRNVMIKSSYLMFGHLVYVVTDKPI
jgi:hypothetical protein